jgi:hypothetical protein
MRHRTYIAFTFWQVLRATGVVACLFFTRPAAFANSGQCQVIITVLGEDQAELIGAHVQIHEIDQKAVSDINGEVLFLLEQGMSYSLSVRYLGFGEQQFTLDLHQE